jgi:hypothetical protein
MRCGDGDGFDWSAVVPRIANPTKIAIIELLCRERRPLSATKMLGLLNDPDLTVSRLDYHCKTLDRAGGAPGLLHQLTGGGKRGVL